jgi:hypothetical protein
LTPQYVRLRQLLATNISAPVTDIYACHTAFQKLPSLGQKYSMFRLEKDMLVLRLIYHTAMILGCVSAFSACSSQKQADRQTSDTAAQTSEQPEDSLVIELPGVDSLSVLELLQREHDVNSRSTAAGAFVTSIGPATNSAEYFWLFSVNDSFPTVACDRCVISGNDRVTWHFRRVGR